MKKKLVAGSVLIIAIAILAMGTYAYLVSEARATNVITTGTVKLTMTEYAEVEGDNGSYRVPYVDPTKVMPGETVSKIPVIQNTGTAEFWTRMKVEINVDGEGINPLDYITIEIDTENWVYNENDGWYYYKSTVAPGDEATPLFSEVTFESSMGNDFKGSSINIAVDAQAVQSKNNPLVGDNYSNLWLGNESIPS